MIQKIFKTILEKRNAALLTAGFGLLVFNLWSLQKDTTGIYQKRKNQPYVFLGEQFEGIKDLLKETPRIGYYTDKTLDDFRTAALFAQAQYTLAPVIMELNNLNMPFIIFDCAREEHCFEVMKENSLIPVRKNDYGIMIAFNPKQRL